MGDNSMIMTEKVVGSATNNAPNDSTATWSVSTTYALGAKVQYLNYIYESLSANNLGNRPDLNRVAWFKERSTNKNACFDPSMDTVTTVTGGDLVITVNCQNADHFALFGVIGESVDVVAIDNSTGDTISVQSFNLSKRMVTNWWEWKKAPFSWKRKVFAKIPPYYNMTVTFTIRPRDGVAGCAYVAYGFGISMGCTQVGGSVSRRVTIQRDVNKVGVTTTDVGVKYERATIPVRLPMTMLDTINDRIADAQGQARLFIGDESGAIESLVMYGFAQEIETPIEYRYTHYNLEIEGIG